MVKRKKEDNPIINNECKICGWKWDTEGEQLPIGCPQCNFENWEIGFNQVCKICDRTYFRLSLHHKNKIHSDNKKENRLWICSHCHSKIHHYIDKDLKKVYELANLDGQYIRGL